MQTQPIYTEATNDRYSGQPRWGEAASDSLQYELFFDDRFLSIRAFKMPTCHFAYAWMFDGQVKELFASYEPLVGDTDSSTLRAENENLSYQLGDGGGQIRIAAATGGGINVIVEESTSTHWKFPPNDLVIHQPLLQVSVELGSEKWNGLGYAKRYTWTSGNEHLYWRFINGPLHFDSEPSWFWTAEAAFDLQKYDYFKIANANGSILAADQPGTFHRDRMAHGEFSGVSYQAEIEDLGRIEHEIRSDGTNTKISQAFCRLNFTAGEKSISGYAMNEIACGTHA